MSPPAETGGFDTRRSDPLARLLEFGLLLFVLVAPLPFGAVPRIGRDVLEAAALSIGVIWLVRAIVRPTVLPPRTALIGATGLLLLASLQILPVPSALVSRVSPEALRIRVGTQPPPEALVAEKRVLGSDRPRPETTPTLSVDPDATASALRTGAACFALFLAATTVAATCGPRKLALALLVSAAFQALYGLLVLASGYERIWNVPKIYYLGSATGTFVNRNHFACFLAMALASGMGLMLSAMRRRRRDPASHRLVDLLGGDGSRILMMCLLLVLGTAGLLASFSRAGIALGLFALALTLLAGARHQGLRRRIVVGLLLVSAAAVPIAQLGSERLWQRYAASAENLTASGGRARVWRDTVEMAAAYPVTGAGFGTFAAAYPLHRSPEVRLYYAHAHNDALQILAEAGLLGAVFLGLLLFAIFSRVASGLAGMKGTVAVGFSAGLLAILLHALIDFNFHIPANLATAAILAGTLLGLPWKNRD